MQKFTHHKIGIAQGDTVLFSDFEHDGDMWTGEGARQTRVDVVFDQAFLSPPVVHVGLTMWDMSNAANARMDLQTEDVTPNGCAIVVRTWGDTKIARVRVGWMAIGAVRDDEDWDLG